MKVQDVDRAVACARRVGGHLGMVEDIPGVGGIATLAEPRGGALALLSPRPAAMHA